MATLLGAASLALILPLTAWGYIEKNDTDAWDSTKFNITESPKAPVILQKKEAAAKKKKDDSAEKEAADAEAQKKKEKEEAAAKEAMEAAQHLPPHMRKFQITTSQGHKMILDSGEIHNANTAFVPNQHGSSGHSGQASMQMTLTKNALVQNGKGALEGDLYLPGGPTGLFKDGATIKVSSIGNTTLRNTRATVQWTSDNTGKLIMDDFQRLDGSHNISAKQGSSVRLDIEDRVTDSVTSVMDMERYKPTGEERESSVNIIAERLADLQKEEARNLPHEIRERTRKQHLEGLQNRYGAKDTYQMPPVLEHPDISCAQAMRINRDGYPINNASFSWKNRSGNINANVDFMTRSSKPVRLVKLGGDQATKAGRLVAHPTVEMDTQRSNLQRNPAKVYGAGSTKFGRGVSNAETATMYRSNYVTDHRRHETPGTTQASVRDIRDISTNKKSMSPVRLVCVATRFSCAACRTQLP